MPATAIAALLYPFFLVPGLIFLNRIETHLPRRERSVFRETATVIFASVGTAAIVLGFYLGLSILWRLPIDSLVVFVADPGRAFDKHPRAVVVGMLVFLLLASAFAWIAATKRIYDSGKSLLWAWSGPEVQGKTAWQTVLLPDVEGDEVFVGVQLKSGIWIQGVHDAHSDVEVETGDRQLILREPLKYQLEDAKDLKELKPFDRMVIQASEIDYIVSYNRMPDAK